MRENRKDNQNAHQSAISIPLIHLLPCFRYRNLSATRTAYFIMAVKIIRDFQPPKQHVSSFRSIPRYIRGTLLRRRNSNYATKDVLRDMPSHPAKVS